MHTLRTRGVRIPPTGLCLAVQENTDGQQSDNVVVDDKRLDIIGPRVSLCSVHKVSDRS